MSEITRYLRFTIWYRVEHWTFMLSFSVLAITGLVQKFATASISIWTIDLLGGIENVRIIHHTSAIVTMFVVIYHIGAIGYRWYVRRVRPTMLPSIKDVTDAWQALQYNLGFRKNYPQGDRYTFAEKVEYYAVVWGTIVMAVTGFMMWNPIATTNFLPGEVIPASKVAHGLEAILAVTAIIIWHLYHVLIRNFNKSMYMGYIDEVEMIEDHPLELADIKAGTAQRLVNPELKKKRQRIFWPVYIVFAAVMLVGVYAFVAYEETAITTRPPAEDVIVFAPLTPTPLPTPIPSQPPSADTPNNWEDGFASLFEGRCTLCHGVSISQGGLDLTSYQKSLEGGLNGPAIVPGDPDTSLVIMRQLTGDHPGQFSGEEISIIRAWIEAGAPEN